MVVIDFLINWVLLPGIIIYGFVSWSKENPDTKFWIEPEDDNKTKSPQANPDKKSELRT